MRQSQRSSSFPTTVLLMVFSFCWGAALELPPAMIEGLKSEKFADRQSATAELLKWSRQQPEPAMDELYRQSRAAADPEVRERCRRVLMDLLNEDYLLHGVGYLGVMMNNLTQLVPLAVGDKPHYGIALVLVQPGTPADAAGLVAGDLLLAIDATPLRQGDTTESVSSLIQSYKAGTKVTLKLFRKGEIVEVPVVLSKRPPAKDLMNIGGLGGLGGFQLAPEAVEAADDRVREAYFDRWFARKKEAVK